MVETLPRDWCCLVYSVKYSWTCWTWTCDGLKWSIVQTIKTEIQLNKTNLKLSNKQFFTCFCRNSDFYSQHLLFNKGIYACVDIFLQTFCVLPCIALYFKDHFEVRIQCGISTFFPGNIPILMIPFLISLDKISLHYIFNPSGEWFCTAHTIFRIRWCWKQKNLKCCKIIVTLYISNVSEWSFFAH